MKPFLSRVAVLVTQLGAVLATWVGCVPEDTPPPPPPPHKINWQGQETGYEGVSTAPPADPKTGVHQSP